MAPLRTTVWIFITLITPSTSNLVFIFTLSSRPSPQRQVNHASPPLCHQPLSLFSGIVPSLFKAPAVTPVLKRRNQIQVAAVTNLLFPLISEILKKGQTMSNSDLYEPFRSGFCPPQIIGLDY